MNQEIKDKTPINLKWALRKMSEFLPPTQKGEEWITHLIWALWTYSDVFLEKEEIDAGRIHFDAEASYEQLAQVMHCHRATAKWRCEQLRLRYPAVLSQQRGQYSNVFQVTLEEGMGAIKPSVVGFDATGAPILSTDPKALAAYKAQFDDDEEEIEGGEEPTYTPFFSPWEGEPDQIASTVADCQVASHVADSNSSPLIGENEVANGPRELANSGVQSDNSLAPLSRFGFSLSLKTSVDNLTAFEKQEEKTRKPKPQKPPAVDIKTEDMESPHTPVHFAAKPRHSPSSAPPPLEDPIDQEYEARLEADLLEQERLSVAECEVEEQRDDSQ